MKVYKGSIVSCDKAVHVFMYPVEDRGKILFVGDTFPAEYFGTLKKDLGTLKAGSYVCTGS